MTPAFFGWFFFLPFASIAAAADDEGKKQKQKTHRRGPGGRRLGDDGRAARAGDGADESRGADGGVGDHDEGSAGEREGREASRVEESAKSG